MNELFLERKGKVHLLALFTWVRSPAATSARRGLATHRRLPSATALHKPPAPWPVNSIPATTGICLAKDAFAQANIPGRHN
jgi:hypothetical protein